jgi:hypothetical protein
MIDSGERRGEGIELATVARALKMDALELLARRWGEQDPDASMKDSLQRLKALSERTQVPQALLA